ncbi:MAG: alpha/beta hydrolase, partial [Candidatus Kapaibacterium sp.]
LLVQGTTDLQVLEADAQALKKAAPDAGLVIITGMNHVLKDAPSDRVENLKTYTDPAAPLSAGLARSIVSFLSR